MRYQNFTITINEFQGDGYPVSALNDGIGRVTTVLAPPGEDLTAKLAALAHPDQPADREGSVRAAGEGLFHWLVGEPIKTHLRLAWDRAHRDGEGLRLRLCIDSPEISAWPWETLYDSERDHSFAASTTTPLVRYFDQANHLNGLTQPQAELPLHLLLVLPFMADLDLARERAGVELVASSFTTDLRVHALHGIVRRTDLADALLTADYEIVHFSGHSASVDGRGYVALNTRDGRPDWIYSGALVQLVRSHKPIRLIVLNTCGITSGEDGRAFQGLAPQLVRSGVPAVVTMQFPITDEVAATFAQEFYKRLCVGEDAGQVDVAVAYARGMLAALHPGDQSWIAPVLYTQAADGLLCQSQQATPAQHASSALAELSPLAESLQLSLEMAEDWGWADPGVLSTWQSTLQRAGDAYRGHLADPRPEVQQVARSGLTVIQRRLTAIDKALS